MTPVVLPVEIGPTADKDEYITVLDDTIVVQPNKQVARITPPEDGDPGISIRPMSGQEGRTVWIGMTEVWTQSGRAIAVGQSLAQWLGAEA